MGRGGRTATPAAPAAAAPTVRDLLRRPRTMPLDLEADKQTVRASEHPHRELVQVLRRQSARLTTDAAPVCDMALDKLFSTYNGPTLDRLLDKAMLAGGAADPDTDALVCDNPHNPGATLHLRAGDHTRCGRPIARAWAQRTRRGQWAAEPDRRCSTCEPHAAAEPACQETGPETLTDTERAELRGVARRALRTAAHQLDDIAAGDDTAAQLCSQVDRAVADALVPIAARRAAEQPRRMLDAIITPDDRVRLERRFGSVQAAPDPTEQQLAIAQRELISRRLSPYADDYTVASRKLCDALLA